MIRSDAAVASSAKWQVEIGKMPACIVHAATTEGHALKPFFFCAFVFGKDIKSKRVRIEVNNSFRFLKGIETDHRKNGAKDLLLHYSSFYRNIFDNGWSDVQAFSLQLPTVNNLSFREISPQAIELFFIDDLSIIIIR